MELYKPCTSEEVVRLNTTGKACHFLALRLSFIAFVLPVLVMEILQKSIQRQSIKTTIILYTNVYMSGRHV